MNYYLTALIVSIVIVFTMNNETGTGGSGGTAPHPRIVNQINVLK